MKEFFFNLFILSAFLKIILSFQGIELPINLTLIFSAFLFVIAFFSLAKKKFKLDLGNPYPFLLLIIYWGWSLVTLSYSASSGYAIWKAILFTMIMLAFFYPVIVDLNIERFLKQFIFMTTLLCPILFLLVPLILFSGFDASTAFYLLLGEISGTVILSIVGGLRYGILRNSVWIYFPLILHLILLTFNPGRGPIIFTLGILAVFAFFQLNKLLNVKTLSILTFAAFVLAVSGYGFYLIFPEMGEFTFERLGKLFSFFLDDNSGADRSASERVDILSFSFRHIFEKGWVPFLFGYGYGSFGKMFLGVDENYYPHNLYVEALFENGLIGCMLISLFIFACLYEIIVRKNYFLLLPITMLFLDAMKSFAITDLRILFCFLGLSVVSHRINANEYDPTDLKPLTKS